MTINKELNGEVLTVSLEGRLDTYTSPELEKELSDLQGVKKLVFDMAALSYVSSAGLRVLLVAQKTMNKQGSMVLCHVNEAVMDILDVTGFTDILTIEA